MYNVSIICLICRVHGPEDSQETVFEEVKPLLTSLLDGWVIFNTNKFNYSLREDAWIKWLKNFYIHEVNIE